MGQFFKFLFASCLGVFLALILLFGIGSAVIFGLVQSAEQPKTIKPNTVLHLTFNDQVPEKTNNLQLSVFDLKNQKVLGLQDILRALETAGDDDRIKGILLEMEVAPGGFVTSGALRQGLQDFRDSGKFVIAYSKIYTQSAYRMASTADKIYLNPVGRLDLRGLGVQIPFYKDMLDRVGIQMNVFYAGKFKSATEPYRRNDMSDENRLQVRAYIDALYADMINEISQSRGIAPDELGRIAGEYLADLPEEALQFGLVDALGYRDEALDDIRDRLGLDEDDKIPMIGLVDYHNSNPPDTEFTTRDKIALLYAEGVVVDGKGETGMIGDKRYVEMIQDIRRSSSIKAVVLRINSPGGSAIASEQIWRELMLLKEAGKPIVVSMGDYAASGGYYIAMAGDSILADHNTLTGSIGVFATFPTLSDLSNEKLGIHWDSVKTGPYAIGLSPFFPLSEGDKKILQRNTDEFYEVFLQRVADGRGMSRDSVNQIAQGRVWTGGQAQEIGLVDRIGDLEQAVTSAAQLAGLEKYRITEYPRTKDPIQQFLEEFMDMETTSVQSRRAMLRSELGEWYPYYEYMREIKENRGIQARLPFLISPE